MTSVSRSLQPSEVFRPSANCHVNKYIIINRDTCSEKDKTQSYNKIDVDHRIRKGFPAESNLELIFKNEWRAIGEGERWKKVHSRKKKLCSRDLCDEYH